MSFAALEVRGLNVRFAQGGAATPVVRDFGLELQPGEIVGLVGESGCGKSVTALALMGLLDDRGAAVDIESLALAGEAVRPAAAGLRAARQGGTAMVFQEPATALDPVFSVGWQLAQVIRRRRGASRKQARTLARDALAFAGFRDPDEILNAYPGQLSGGMRQLVMIAMAMAVEPRVLLADEPTTALDVTSQRQVLDRLLELRERTGVAILLITHDLGVVARCCSRVMVMYCGRVVEEAPYGMFHDHPRHPYSAGLLAAAPRISPDAVPAPGIPGQVPSLAHPPPGCAFHPRCERARGDCSERRPPLAADGERRTACHYPL